MVVLVPALGVALGYLAGGRLRGLLTLRLRALWLVWAAVAVGLLHLVPGVGDATRPAMRLLVPLLTAVALTAFVVLNLDGQQGWLRLATWLLAAGWLLNLTVVAANGGMPTPAEALASGHAGGVLGAHLHEHGVLSSDVKLWWLGDVIRIRLPHLLVPVSVGDLLLATGVVLLIVLAMRHAPRAPGTSGTRIPDPAEKGTNA